MSMTTIHTDRQGTKIYEVEGFALMEADGCGVRDIQVALMSDKAEAELWASESKGYRTVRPYKQTVKVFSTLQALKDDQTADLRAKALAKLSPEERIGT